MRSTAALITLPAFGRSLGRQRADPAPNRRHLAAAAEKADAELLERALVGDAGQLGREPVFERREVRCEVRHPERRCWTKQNARSFDQAFLQISGARMAASAATPRWRRVGFRRR